MHDHYGKTRRNFLHNFSPPCARPRCLLATREQWIVSSSRRDWSREAAGESEKSSKEPREAALGINQRLEEVRLERESSDGDDRLHKRLERESLRGSVRGPGCLTSLPCPEKCVAGWGAFNFPRSSRRCSTPGLDPERNLGPFSSPFYLNDFQNVVSAKNFDVPTGPLCNSPSIFGKVSMYKIFVNSKRCNLCTRPSFFERTFSRKDATLPRTNAGSSCLGGYSKGSFLYRQL